MQLEIEQSLLEKAVRLLQRVVVSKPQLPILSSILIEARENSVQLSATDLYYGAKVEIVCQVQEKGAGAAPASQLKELLSSLSGGMVKLSTKDEGALKFESNGVKARLPLLNASDFPTFPEIKGTTIVFQRSWLKKLESLIFPCVSKDSTRPVLTAILMRVSDQQTEVVSTDGFRLSRLVESFSISAKEKELEPALIPMRFLSELGLVAELESVDEISVTIDATQKQLRAKVGAFELSSRLIEGEFPPYQKILPPSPTIEIEVDREELVSHIKRALIFAKDSSQIVTIEIGQHKLKITSQAASSGSYEGSLEYHSIKGDSVKVAFNGRYVLDILSSAPAEQVRLRCTEPLRPVELVFPDLPQYQYIVMPVRVTEVG